LKYLHKIVNAQSPQAGPDCGRAAQVDAAAGFRETEGFAPARRDDAFRRAPREEDPQRQGRLDL